MASLANQTISSTYDGLIKTSTDQPVGISGVQLLEDGVGNSLALSVGRANQGVTITGTLTATSISGVLADGVTATTQSSGDNSTKVATTAYVDAQVTASDLDFAGDSGTGAVDLDSQSLTIAGTANEIETSASGQTITIGLPSSVTVGTLTATTLAGTLSTAAQPNITSVGTLTGLTTIGSVGIGATGTQKLVVGGADVTQVSILSSTTTGKSQLYFGDADSVFRGLVDYDHSGDFMRFYAAAAERMRIDSSGNVGIGTSSPASKLAVKDGNVYIDRDTTSGTYAFGFYRSGAERGRLGFDYSSSALNIQADGVMTFLTAGENERMRIDSSGRVGIGTSSPAQKLDVNGIADFRGSATAANGSININATDPTIRFRRTGGTTDKSIYELRAISAGGVNDYFQLRLWNDAESSATQLLRVDTDGIKFGNDTAAANALDDYEEGTFTPTAVGGTTAGTTVYSNQRGFYTKIGRQVNVTIRVAYSSMTGTGPLRLEGLPFNLANLDANYIPVAAISGSNYNWSAGTSYLVGLAFPNTDYVIPYGYSDDGSATAQNCVNEAADWRFSLTYFTT